MRSRGLLMLLIAIVAGLAAVVVAARWMQQQGGDRGRIAVANVDIDMGGRITPEMIRMVEWPATSVPEGAFLDGTKLDGRVAITNVRRGEPLIESRLAPEGSKGGLSAVVANGKRAMTVRVNDVVGVAGFALPGTFVDIMVNTQEEGAQRGDRDRAVSKIVLERILVLAVAQEVARDDTKPRVVNAVTLEVTPDQAERLDLARSVGTLSLVLRNQVDPRPGATAGATRRSVLGAATAPMPKVDAAPAAAPPGAARSLHTALLRPAEPARYCIGVIDGNRSSKECL